LLVVVKRLKPLTVLSGTVYRLASSMSDHTPVLFNVFEDWNEESRVQHISFDSIRMQAADSHVPSLCLKSLSRSSFQWFSLVSLSVRVLWWSEFCCSVLARCSQSVFEPV